MARSMHEIPSELVAPPERAPRPPRRDAPRPGSGGGTPVAVVATVAIVCVLVAGLAFLGGYAFGRIVL